MLPITRQISDFNHSNGNDIKFIVIHSTGNGTDTASDNANYFNEADRQASAHYFVDSDSIYQVVEDYNAAWHCGDGHGHGAYGITNHNSIGIEMCETNGSIAENTIANTIDLVKSLMNKYNVSINNVVRHYDASRKCCPEPWSDNSWTKWYEFKTRLNGMAYSKDFIKSIQHDLQRVSCLESGEINATGQLDAKTKAAIKQFRSIVGLPNSENIDSQLINALNAITKKPIIGPGWPSNPIATRFIQWWLGAPKTSVFDDETVKRVKVWQKAVGVYYDPDAVIREESWVKILK